LKNKATHRWLVCWSAGLLLLSCTNRPHHVLSEEKMAEVLTDLYITESAMRDNQPDSLPLVFKKHRISEAKFDTSLVWYHANLDKYQKVNELIIAECTRQLQVLQTKQKTIQYAETLDKSFIYPPEKITPIDIPEKRLLP
jgi:hypothetical protein